MSRRSWTHITIAVFVAGGLAMGAAACAGEGDLDTYNETPNQQGNQNDQNDPDNQNDQNDPDNQNQEEPEAELTQIHQWCAAAGQSDDGELTAVHCSAPHDASGFEASDGEHTWQPGAFHVVAE